MTRQIKQRHHIGGSSLELVIGDIASETTDAIVNAANSYLLGGGGVDGAIHAAAGPALLAECKQVRAQHGLLAPGHAIGTAGGNLKAKYVIHTVGPVWQGGDDGEAAILESCYRKSLQIAEQLGCTSVSFPSVATGAFGYPLHAAAKIAIGAMIQNLPLLSSVVNVRFVLFDSRTHRAYSDAALKLTTVGRVTESHLC
ncbi:MAG TPA: O-acetyl-ADP-ribose deacetylase [Candidatus Angelobacter sp.]|nr:O-acetyl-ADP-ribose deacetylase [Candidatus Angelobacter sp.]